MSISLRTEQLLVGENSGEMVKGVAIPFPWLWHISRQCTEMSMSPYKTTSCWVEPKGRNSHRNESSLLNTWSWLGNELGRGSGVRIVGKLLCKGLLAWAESAELHMPPMSLELANHSSSVVPLVAKQPHSASPHLPSFQQGTPVYFCSSLSSP